VQEIGQSLLITLPKEWTTAFKVKKGTLLKIMVSDDGSLAIAPEFNTPEKKKESVMTYNEHFKRMFFREYFEGNERIIIHFQKPIPSDERKDLALFLKRFMNVQVIEDNDKKMVVKSFRIEELTLEECLSRMYFLSRNVLEELSSSNDSHRVQELRDTMTRFYYMLVMQVRRFLGEGKYIKDKQTSLIRAMDIRMVAEKIQRIAEFAASIERLSPKEKAFLAKFNTFYGQAFLFYMNRDYEHAYPLWNEEKQLERSFKKKDNTITEIRLLRMLRYAKEISMLVR
jgi:phosphate uptake regulator